MNIIKKTQKITALLFFCLIPYLCAAQSFDKGLAYYKQKKYKQALHIFNQIQQPRGYLFAAKSYYAMGQYQQAQAYLNNITNEASARLVYETIYTTALVQFQEKHFAQSLSNLHQVLLWNGNDEGLKKDAGNLYQQILNYLTTTQRKQVINKVSSDSLRFNVFKSALGRVDFGQAVEIYKSFQSKASEKKWKNKAHKLKSTFRDVSSYRRRYGSSPSLTAPDGTIYTLGVALPQYKKNNRTYKIVQGLYFGAAIAVKNFNRHHSNVKAKLRFLNTGSSDDSLKLAVKKFKRREGDVLIGPLFSKQAKAMVSIANHFKVPSIAPLANSNINPADSYMFQANPTYAMHGKQMADYAINHLHLNNFTVIADKGTKGAISAESFKNEVGRLGGNIDHFFKKDYQYNNIQLSETLQQLSGNTQQADAVYAPFTERGSLKMIDYLVDDLQKKSKKAMLFGSQEYQKVNYRDPKYHSISFYFTEGSYQASGSRSLRVFKRNYERAFGQAGNHYSLIGYDLATFVLQTLSKVANPALLKNALTHHSLYRGLIQNIQFDEQHVNKAVKILKAGSGQNPSIVN